MKYHFFITAALAASMTGCLYVAPIDEDPEPPDTLPQIDAIKGVTPSMGLVNINLTYGGSQDFVISGYSDDNLDQKLYHRIIFDYRAAGVSVNPVFTVAPKVIEPGTRDRISYNFKACTAAKSYPIGDGKIIDVYLVLSDREFKHQNQLFSAKDFFQPFEIEGEKRNPVWVQWTIQFRGECPEN